MEFYHNALRETVRNIWTVILGFDVEDLTNVEAALRRLSADRTLTACVHINGAWSGSVLIYCSAALARAAAAVMFGKEPVQVTSEDVEDALGELANMTGGNMKALLPQPCELSLPAVVEGLDYHFVVPGSTIISRVLLAYEDDPFLITLLEKASTDEP